MCRILETSNTRITSLCSTAIPIGHFCAEGIEIKCPFLSLYVYWTEGSIRYSVAVCLCVTDGVTNRNTDPKRSKNIFFKNTVSPKHSDNGS